MFLPLQALLILSIVTKINGHKDDIEARIYMDRIHPTPTPSVKENFEASVVKVKKMVQKGAAIAIAMMEQYADFMRDQECQPICQGRFVLYKKFYWCLPQQKRKYLFLMSCGSNSTCIFRIFNFFSIDFLINSFSFIFSSRS